MVIKGKFMLKKLSSWIFIFIFAFFACTNVLGMQGSDSEGEIVVNETETFRIFTEHFGTDSLIIIERWLKVENQNCFTGSVSFSISKTHSFACVNMLFVKREFRGQGVAQLLLRTALNHIKQFPEIHEVKLQVSCITPQELQAAKHIYLKFGFIYEDRHSMLMALNLRQ